MKVLVTAGNTMAMIDDVRGISNIFHGRTGAMIADACAEEAHDVTLLTSHPDIPLVGHVRVLKYKTYDQLLELMRQEICSGIYDLVIHSAAVSDYTVAYTYVPCEELSEDLVSGDRLVIKKLEKVGKISSSHKRLFLELVPTEKIIDKIRRDWNYRGFLVKFKLEVGVKDGELITIACKSRAQSDADLIVANCLAWSKARAYVIGRDDVVHSVVRTQIATAILRRMQ